MLEHGVHAPPDRSFRFARLGEDVNAHVSLVLFIPRAAAHRLVRRENGFKDGVDGAKNVLRRTEILRERIALLQLVRLLREELRTAAAEPVDGLLGIADVKYFLTSKVGENGRLHGIDVLIFVHKQDTVALAHVLFDVGIFQNGQSILFQIAVIEHARFLLLAGVLRVIGEQQLAERRRNAARRRKPRLLFLAGADRRKPGLNRGRRRTKRFVIVDRLFLFGRAVLFGDAIPFFVERLTISIALHAAHCPNRPPCDAASASATI